MFSNWNFEFYSPWFLLLFLLLVPIFIRDLTKKRKTGIKVPTINNMKENRSFLFILFILKLTKYGILTALIIALARPRTFSVSQERDDTKGIDMILAIDVSYSMLARDLEPDRLQALKKIAVDFVNKRPNDRIGIVAYSGEAIAKVPVTLDHQILNEEIQDLNSNELLQGTSIGDGLAVSVAHLKDSKAKSKIVILMTDGVNTVPDAISPLVGAELARNNNIKVYTIGIGTNGYALMPTAVDNFTGDLIFTQAKVTIDEPILREVSQITGGKYYRATSTQSLADVYGEINQLEKSDLKSNTLFNYEEYFRVFLWIAFGLLLIDALLRWVLYKSIV